MKESARFYFKVCTYLTLWILCNSSLALSQEVCRNLFSAEKSSLIYWGQLSTNIAFPFKVEPGSQVYILGSGIKGGTVYRVKNINGEFRTYKVYNNEENAKKDLMKFKFLGKIYQRLRKDSKLLRLATK